MARKQTSLALNSRQELISALDQSRDRITLDATLLGDALNVPKKIEASFQTYRYWWIGGGVVTGLLIAKSLLAPFRNKTHSSYDESPTSDDSNVFFSLLRIAGKQIIRLSRPTLMKMAEKKVTQWFTKISEARQKNTNTR